MQPNGSKLWRYKLRVHGTEGLQALGVFPEIGLAKARGLHSDDWLRQERASSENESVTPVKKTEKMSTLAAKPKARRVLTISDVPRVEQAYACWQAAHSSVRLYSPELWDLKGVRNSDILLPY